jgi:hypothetical protein
MTPLTSAVPPAPSTTWVMRLEVQCDEPQEVGQMAAGYRENFPILGGRFFGPSIQGDVLPGVDRFMRRSDGVGVLDARYALRTSDGVIINLHNRGLLIFRPAAQGIPPEEGPYVCHCVPTFEAPQGPYAWLNQFVFAGRVEYPAPGQVSIDLFRFD